MPKQGQHSNDAHDSDKSKGHNRPDKSVTIVTGSPKKQETYAEQARQGKDPGVQPQAAKNEWNEDTHERPKVDGERPNDRNTKEDSDVCPHRKSAAHSDAGYGDDG